jgi:hypothetical protein
MLFTLILAAVFIAIIYSFTSKETRAKYSSSQKTAFAAGVAIATGVSILIPIFIIALIVSKVILTGKEL